MPAANDVNFIGVYTTEEQRHSAAGSKGSSGNVIGVDASVVRNGKGGGTEQ